MKIITWVLLAGLTLPSIGQAAKVNVPGDFPGTFSMDFLAGSFHLDIDPIYSAGIPTAIDTVTLNTINRNLLFDATAFDFSGPGAGTSTLSLVTGQTWEIGEATFLGHTAVFSVTGTGSGTLVDNADSSAGHWTMNIPLSVSWNGQIVDLPSFNLSSDATYSYEHVTNGSSILTGTIMDYESGDTFLVGQQTVTSGAFSGVRLTLGVDANDPVVGSPVPLPAGVWLFGLGLALLARKARSKQI